MPFILNLPLAAVKSGEHIDVGIDAVLIQIVDPEMDFPIPVFNFKNVHKFKFFDVEFDDKCKDEGLRFSKAQAIEIVGVLSKALEENRNVIVHCVAGLCRSGAVAEVGVMMGFSDGNAYRIPNLLVKKLLMRELGFTYD